VKYIAHKKYGIELSYRLPWVEPVSQTRAAIDALIQSSPVA